MHDPIAEQELTLRRPTGGEQKAICRIWPPERNEYGGYECRAEIAVPGEELIRFSAIGADAFQAITLTMCRIPMSLLRFEASPELSSQDLYEHWFPPALVRPLDVAPPDWSRRKELDSANTWAERVLDFTPNDGGEQRRMFVRIGRPYTQPGMGGSWSVDVEIHDGMKSPLRTHAIGEDSIEATQFAMRQVSALLSSWEERGKIAWCGEPGSGFERVESDPWVASAKVDAAKDP